MLVDNNMAGVQYYIDYIFNVGMKKIQRYHERPT